MRLAGTPSLTVMAPLRTVPMASASHSAGCPPGLCRKVWYTSAMVEALALSGHPLVWRGEWERMFCRVESFAWSRGEVGAREADVALTEVDFEEGVEI